MPDKKKEETFGERADMLFYEMWDQNYDSYQIDDMLRYEQPATVWLFHRKLENTPIAKQ